MRFDHSVVIASLLGIAAATAISAHPPPELTSLAPPQAANELFKRRGGGGGGARGGGSSGGRSGGSSGGSSGGGGGGGSSWVHRFLSSRPKKQGHRISNARRPRRGNTAPNANTGGTSRGGTGPSRSFNGGRSYAGGSPTPFRSGRVSPLGIAPFLLIGASLAFWPGVWLYGAHMYPYRNGHRFFNATTGRDETINVICGCGDFAECGCDDNNSTAYFNELIGNGSYEALNKSIVNVGQFRGSKALLINGTLPNGTTADGPDEGEGDSSSAAGLVRRDMIHALGFWPVVAVIFATVFSA